MARILLPMVGGANEHKSLPFDAQITVNLYSESGGELNPTRKTLLHTPGLKLLLTLPGIGPIRGMYEASNGRAFAVRSDGLYEIFHNNTYTFRGNINTTNGEVSIIDNGLDLLIADGDTLVKMDLSSNAVTFLPAPTFGNVPPPNTTPLLAYVDGYIFGFTPSTSTIGQFRHSDLRDVDTWRPGDIYTAEGSPDGLVSVLANRRELWLFGSKSYEVWFDTGDISRTFARSPGSFQQIGCGAKNSVAEMNGKVFWLGADKEGVTVIWMSVGYKPQRISQHWIESKIADFDDVSSAIGYTYQQEGHYFYVLTFAEETFVFDLTTQQWHTRSFLNQVTGCQERHRINTHMFAHGLNLVGDYVNGNIYEYDLKTYTDNGVPIIREKKFPHYEQLRVRLFWHSLQIVMETGRGLSNVDDDDGANPKLQLRYSDNGGRSYGNWRVKEIGKQGEYSKRIIFRKLGRSRERVYHLRISEPIPISIEENTVAEVTPGVA